MNAKNLLRKIAPLYDATIGTGSIAFDSHAWAGIAFDLAAAADHYHGHMVPTYRPGLGGSVAALDDSMKSMGAGRYIRPILRRAKPETLEQACAIAWRYFTACSHDH